MRIKEITQRWKATGPGNWQRSYYAPTEGVRRQTPMEAQKAHEAMEAKIIRGPGTVGSPACNPVMLIETKHPEIMEFVAHSKADIKYLLREIQNPRDEMYAYANNAARALSGAQRAADDEYKAISIFRPIKRRKAAKRAYGLSQKIIGADYIMNALNEVLTWIDYVEHK